MSAPDDSFVNGAVVDADTAPRPDGEIVARRVGPGARPAPVGERTTTLAADNHLAAALLTLWQRVSDADGAVGFEPGTPRSEIAPAVTEAINGLRAGTRHAVVLTAGNDLVGVAFLVRRPSKIQRHLGEVVSLMVDPDRQGSGLGRRLVLEIARLASEIGVDTLLLGARDREELHAFYRATGFVEYGRLPDAVRLADGSSFDEVRYRRVLAG
ncbi:GNAT family N-acetyltransferase [Nakamurella deserti]|uniref:GNAT family N-acetyltransferase n=1 Tax=Nakamurella deserti TaxID=2164074 RepID=UPI0013004EFC|nr:GNAT family N-acetyltransferase [Nakamurella deserti]